MSDHIAKTCSAAFYHLYNIRSIRQYLTTECTETLIHAFITSRLDYCNSLLHGSPGYLLHKLQRVQNAAARIIFKESKYCHITPLLRTLHWLPVVYRIQFKILLLTFKAIHGNAPCYISDLISVRTTAHIVSDQVIELRSTIVAFVHQTHQVIDLFTWLHLNSGMASQATLGAFHQYIVLRKLSRLFYLRVLSICRLDF